jgi:hypothetical protein
LTNHPNTGATHARIRPEHRQPAPALRNPIFTAAKSVWGYEIQATSSMTSSLPLSPEQVNVGAAVIAGDYVGLNTILARNKKMLLAYTREQLQKQIPMLFPPSPPLS